ncbi:ABC transporter permease [Streptomyces sp. TRM43335]|uniref:ABC transporter permease n=1 Tax=Streptomyces taklimakanensis TaxID=2569853 RepID=A0A6G2BG62_9ACTN|nr:ABC transporter permease [Streptomyces taklimakanensis]MTE21059.1 ABC transporter permease [Streptomyces taklimakanensis]
MTTPQQNPAAPPVPPTPPRGAFTQAPAPTPWPAEGAGYASPIPVRNAHLGHAIASEWTKIRTVRSTVWTLAVMFALVVGIGFLVALALGNEDQASAPVLAGGFFGLMLGQLCVITLGVLVITSEYSTGMIRTTFTACPRRARVLTAKALVFFLLSFTTTLVACTLTALFNMAFVGGKPVSAYVDPESLNEETLATGEAVASAGEWMGATVGAALFVALLGLLSLAVGALLRSTPGAITAMLGVVLLPFIASLFLFGENVREFGEKLREYSVLNGLSSLFRLSMEADGGGTGWPLVGLLAAVTLAALIGAYARITVRDV